MKSLILTACILACTVGIATRNARAATTWAASSAPGYLTMTLSEKDARTGCERAPLLPVRHHRSPRSRA
jgi:hypothetical protein